MKKGLNEGIDEGMLWWFGHVERMERDRTAKRVLVVIQWVCHSYIKLLKGRSPSVAEPTT